MSTPTADELREAEYWRARVTGMADGELVRWIRGIASTKGCLALILEQGEEMEWCPFHEAGGERGLDCWGSGLDGQDLCKMVPSLRIPSAVLDPAKNEEDDRESN